MKLLAFLAVIVGVLALETLQLEGVWAETLLRPFGFGTSGDFQSGNRIAARGAEGLWHSPLGAPAQFNVQPSVRILVRNADSLWHSSLSRPDFTSSPEATPTPVPTATPQPSPTPAETPTPTATPLPTATPTSEPPTVPGITSTVERGGTVTITLQASDAETCELSFTAPSNASRGSLSSITDQPCTEGSPNSDTATLTYTHDGSDTTSDSFTYEVCDNQECVAASVGITITAP